MADLLPNQRGVAMEEPAQVDELALRKRRRRHCEMLAVCLIAVVLSFLLEVRTDQKVEFSIAPDWPAPETCLTSAMWGLECPGCGLTRSFIFLASGEWQAAMAMNRVGWLFALAVMFQIPYRLYLLNWLSKRGLPEPVPQVANRLFGGGLIFALVANWGLRLCGL